MPETIHIIVLLVLFSFPILLIIGLRKLMRWKKFEKAALVITPLGWLLYLYYEIFFLPAHCSGDCAIRVDLLVIAPVLLALSINYVLILRRRRKI
jgi:hypothetical protein